MKGRRGKGKEGRREGFKRGGSKGGEGERERMEGSGKVGGRE